MRTLIIDCSFIISILFLDETAESIDLSIYRLYVPSIFYLECVNVINVSLKRKRITELEHQQYLSIINRLPLNSDTFSTTPESVVILSKLSKTLDLSAYDASYLELAIRLEGTLATRDKKLIEACRATHVATI